MNVELLVLANSAKNGGRCLAGLDVANGKWIRPVANEVGGHLANSLTIVDGHRIRPGDLIRIGVGQSVPQRHHPENRLLSGELALIQPNALLEYATLVVAELERTNDLVNDCVRRLESQEVLDFGVGDSLGLVHATDISFYRNEYWKYRVAFNVGTQAWDISNTDDWGRWSGILSAGLICVSLAEIYPAQQAYYKLAAGVIPMEFDDLSVSQKEARASAHRASRYELRNLRQAVAVRFGTSPKFDSDDRLNLDAWFFQATVEHRCIYCQFSHLEVFRSHEPFDREGNQWALHRFGLYCPNCVRVFTTPLEDEQYRRALTTAAEAVAKVKEICPNCS